MYDGAIKLIVSDSKKDLIAIFKNPLSNLFFMDDNAGTKFHGKQINNDVEITGYTWKPTSTGGYPALEIALGVISSYMENEEIKITTNFDNRTTMRISKRGGGAYPFDDNISFDNSLRCFLDNIVTDATQFQKDIKYEIKLSFYNYSETYTFTFKFDPKLIYQGGDYDISQN